MGKVIPKGIPIGRVIQVVPNSLAGTTSALLKPSARYDQVEQVLIAKVGQGSE
jgi:cell shape-determining protein MreC